MSAKIEIELDDLFAQPGDPDPEFGHPPVPGTEVLRQMVVDTLANRFLSESSDEVRRMVTERVDKAVDARIASTLDVVFSEPFQRRHSWGDPIDKTPVTIKMIIEEHVREFVNAPARRRDSYSSGGTPTSLAEIVQKVTSEIATPVVNEIRNEIRKTMIDDAIQAATAALQKGR